MILRIGRSVKKKLGIKVGNKMITDFETWMLDVGMDRTFQMLEYRRPGDWTPRELESKYIDQSQYVDDRYTYIKIKEAIELPDGDILIGYIDVTDSEGMEILTKIKHGLIIENLVNWKYVGFQKMM